MKLSEFLTRYDDTMKATMRLNEMGIPASYFTVMRWMKKKHNPSRAWVILLAQKGIEV